MYCTVFMYGLDGRLSPLSYNYVCRVSIIKKYLYWKSVPLQRQCLQISNAQQVATDFNLGFHAQSSFYSPHACLPIPILVSLSAIKRIGLWHSPPQPFSIMLFYSFHRRDFACFRWDSRQDLERCSLRLGEFIKFLPISRKLRRYKLIILSLLDYLSHKTV